VTPLAIPKAIADPVIVFDPARANSSFSGRELLNSYIDSYIDVPASCCFAHPAGLQNAKSRGMIR
jgi:hypothetical protein